MPSWDSHETISPTLTKKAHIFKEWKYILTCLRRVLRINQVRAAKYVVRNNHHQHREINRYRFRASRKGFFLFQLENQRDKKGQHHHPLQLRVSERLLAFRSSQKVRKYIHLIMFSTTEIVLLNVIWRKTCHTERFQSFSVNRKLCHTDD